MRRWCELLEPHLARFDGCTMLDSIELEGCTGRAAAGSFLLKSALNVMEMYRKLRCWVPDAVALLFYPIGGYSAPNGWHRYGVVRCSGALTVQDEVQDDVREDDLEDMVEDGSEDGVEGMVQRGGAGVICGGDYGVIR